MRRLPKLPKERYFIVYSITNIENQLEEYSYRIIDQLLVDDVIPMRDQFRKNMDDGEIDTLDLVGNEEDFNEQLTEFKAKCVALNRAYEDDILYLKLIKFL